MSDDKLWKLLNARGKEYYVQDEHTKSTVEFFKSRDEAMAKRNKIQDETQKIPTVNEMKIENDYALYSEEEINNTKVELPSGCYRLVDLTVGYNRYKALAKMDLRTDGLKFKHDAFEHLLQDIQGFYKSEEHYIQTDSMYKRAYLLYGIPGTGKTTLIRSLITNILKEKEVVVIFTDEALPVDFVGPLNSDKRNKIIVFEELTTAMTYPEDVKEILDFLDGETSIMNSITIATTNYPEKLPDNFVDRKGRFELVFEVKLLSPESAIEFAESLIKRVLTVEEKNSVKEMTIAEIKDACLQYLIKNKSITAYKEELKKGKKLKDKGFEASRMNSMGIGRD